MKMSWKLIGSGLMLAFAAQSALGQQGPRRGGQDGGQRPGGGRPGGGDPIARVLDADQDGVISAAEIANAAVALKTLDANKDGQLTVDEIRPRGRGFGGPGGPGGGGDFVARIMGYDADGDGKVTSAELPEQMQRMFGRMDANNDGAIDKTEAEQMSQRFGRGRDEGQGRPGAGRGGNRPQRPE